MLGIIWMCHWYALLRAIVATRNARPVQASQPVAFALVKSSTEADRQTRAGHESEVEQWFKHYCQVLTHQGVTNPRTTVVTASFVGRNAHQYDSTPQAVIPQQSVSCQHMFKGLRRVDQYTEDTTVAELQKDESKS